MKNEAGEVAATSVVDVGSDHEVAIAPGLYLVATPIGNLEDITLRALRVLRSVDRVACEDTRQTQKLLRHYGIRKPMVSYHLHNEQLRAEELITALRAGGRIAIVSDAGTPGISDPGEAIVREAVKAGVAIFPIPGAIAAVSALVASGLSAERFTFQGFPPAKAGQRQTSFEHLRERMITEATDGTPATQIFYEAPHRILDSLKDLAKVFGPAQKVVLARELTKVHEEILRGSISEVVLALDGRNSVRGEMVLLLDGVLAGSGEEAKSSAELPLVEAIRVAVREGLSEKDALKRAAKARGLSKSDAYREWQRGRR